MLKFALSAAGSKELQIGQEPFCSNSSFGSGREPAAESYLSDMNYKKEKIYFSTLTINNWIAVFHDFPGTISFLLNSWTYCEKELDIKIYAFVIMKDHIHLVWHALGEMPIKTIATKF